MTLIAHLSAGFRFVSGGIAAPRAGAVFRGSQSRASDSVLIFDNGVEREEPSRLSRFQRNHLITERGSFIELNVRWLRRMHGTHGYRVKV